MSFLACVDCPCQKLIDALTATGAISSRATEAELRALVHEHSNRVYRVALSIVRDPGLAEDVTQETFIKVWEKRSSFRGDSPIRSWILQIAHNAAVSRLRKIRDEAWDPDLLPEGRSDSDVERKVEARTELERLGEALDGLDELSRSIVMLREVEGLSYEDIADTLGLNLPTIKTRLLRARRALRVVVDSGEVPAR